MHGPMDHGGHGDLDILADHGSRMIRPPDLAALGDADIALGHYGTPYQAARPYDDIALTHERPFYDAIGAHT